MLKSRKRDTNGINGKFNEEKDKIMHSGCLLKLKRGEKREEGKTIYKSLRFEILVRESVTSL